jgi:hypothetical protein
MLKSAARFFDADAPHSSQRASRRTTILAQGGHQSVKHSSVLGIGRADAVSHGVADNFAFSNYDPEWAQRTQGGASKAAPAGSSHSMAPQSQRHGDLPAPAAAPDSAAEQDHFSQRIEAKFAETFKYGVGDRAPNRVFDNDPAAARLVPAVPDREQQHQRIMHEMNSTRGGSKQASRGGGTDLSSSTRGGGANRRPAAASVPRGASLMAEARLLQAQRHKATLDTDVAMVRALS